MIIVVVVTAAFEDFLKFWFLPHFRYYWFQPYHQPPLLMVSPKHSPTFFSCRQNSTIREQKMRIHFKCQKKNARKMPEKCQKDAKKKGQDNIFLTFFGILLAFFLYFSGISAVHNVHEYFVWRVLILTMKMF